MAQRPERKKSSLGAAHPIEHQNTAAPAVVERPVDRPAAPLAPSEVQAPPVARAAAKPAMVKGSFYTDKTTLEQIRAAWYHTPTTSGEREASLSDFLLEAALERMSQREKKYNAGKPFPAVASGKIARGRRAG